MLRDIMWFSKCRRGSGQPEGSSRYRFGVLKAPHGACPKAFTEPEFIYLLFISQEADDPGERYGRTGEAGRLLMVP